MPLSELSLSSLYSASLSDTFEAVILANADGIVLDWDSHAETLFGWARGEIVGRNLNTVFDNDSSAALVSELRRLAIMPEASERHNTLVGINRSGIGFTVDCSIQLLNLGSSADEDVGEKKLYNFCIFVRDIEQFKDVYGELRKRERRYRILSYFSASVFGNDSIDAVLWDIAKNCIAELDFEDAVVYWLDAARGVLVQKAAFGSGKESHSTVLNPIEILLGSGIVGTTATTQATERIADTMLDSRYIADDAVRYSELAVPIVYKGVVLGVIDSEHSARNFFTKEDALLVEQMAAIAATKIVRIQAEERVREMNEQLEMLVQERTAELSDANEEIRRQVEVLAQQTQEIECTNTILQEKNEELSKLNQEFYEASHFKTQVLSIVAHDLKNPLSAILNYTELSLHEISLHEIPSDSPATTFVSRIADATKYMLQLITSLLDSAAIDLGRIELRLQTLSIVPLLAAVIDNYESRASAKGQRIVFEAQSKLRINGDEERLYQVFDNLVSNAVKYSPLGKTIQVRVSDITAKKTRECNPCVRVEIQDEGPGFSEADTAHIFGFFQRLSAKPTGGEHSTGIGLAIVKKIIDLHGGVLQVNTELGSGTIFIVDLQAA